MQIRIAGTINDSIVDGPGIRFTVFTQGCFHNCLGCHNPQTHNPKLGKLVDIDEIMEDIKRNPLLSGVTLSGGEPFEQVSEILELIEKIKEIGLDVIIYSGYTYKELIAKNNLEINKILDLSDYLIDGKFEITKKSYQLLFKGSSNQRIIDLNKSRLMNKLVESDFSDY
jgi:anaerobic ribonucleoside-triphosphate reductase activating protein